MKRLLIVSGALLLVAAFSGQRLYSLRSEAAEVAERSRAAAQAFSTDFRDSDQDAELTLLDERRSLIRSALRWRVAGSVALLFSGLSVLGAWVARQIARAAAEIEQHRGENG